MLKLCVNVCLRLNFNKKPHFTENEGFLLQISTQNRFNRNFEHNLTKIENLSLNFRKFDYFFFKFNKNAEYLHLLEDFPKNHFESKTEVQLIHRVLVTYF